MADGALDVLVRFVADSKQVTQETAKVTGTGSKVKTWAKGIGAALGGAFAVDKIKDFVNAGAELQDQISAGQQIFGSAAKSVENWAARSTNAFGISKTDALAAANTFATFGKAAGLTGTELGGFATKLTGLAGDLASFRGTSTEQAITAIGAALRGESEPIRAYGVLLDAASLKAQALSMGLVKGTADAGKVAAAQLTAQRALIAYNAAVKKHGENSTEASMAQQQFELAQGKVKAAVKGTVPELSNQQKVLASQALIFKQTKDAQGDFARTGDSAANQQKKLKASMEDVSSTIGTALLPVVEKLLPYIQDLATFVERNVGWLLPLAAGIAAVAVAVKAWQVAQLLLNTTMLASPVFWVVLAVAALIAVIVVLVKNWDKVKAAFKAAFDWIKQNWPLLLAILTGPIGLAVLAIVKHKDKILDALKAAWDWVKEQWHKLTDILTGPFSAAADIIKPIFGGFLKIMRELPGKIGDAFKTLGDIITAPFRAAFNAIAGFWNRTLGAVEFKTPSWLGPLGNKGFSIPDMPTLDTGGFITRTGVALVHRGETVVPAGAGGNVFNITVNAPPLANPAAVGRAAVDAIRAYETVAGPGWRRTPSGRAG